MERSVINHVGDTALEGVTQRRAETQEEALRNFRRKGTCTQVFVSTIQAERETGRATHTGPTAGNSCGGCNWKEVQ